MISNKCYYGLRAMLELALREGDGCVTIGEIAAAQDIPARFLEAIMRQLKQAGLADSVRGKEGGYFLAKPAHLISVGSVIRLFEGPLVAINQRDKSSRRAPSRDVFADLWNQAEASLATVFENVNFSELAEREKSRMGSHVANYSI